MCQPSPRGRCPKDAAKATESKLAAYKAEAVEFYSKTEAEHIAEVGVEGYENKVEKINDLVAEVDKAKAFMYATPTGISSPQIVAGQINTMQKDLPAQARLVSGLNDVENRRTGRVLSKFQAIAKAYAKENPDSNNIETARLMANGVFANARGTFHSAMNESHKKSLGEALRKAPESEHGKIKRQMAAEHRANVAVLDKAFSYATEDAMDAVEKDRVKNSQTFENTIDKHKFGFYKNTDGSFTVRTRFDVKAKNLEEAVRKAEGSFNLEDVQLTMSKPKNGVYTVDTAYVYKGGEKLEDAQKFQKEAWNGTPEWRNTLDQARRLEDYYDRDNEQGKYAVGFRG